MIESNLLNYIEDQLTVTSRRQQALSANIANVDTPGYRAQDVRFEEHLQLLQVAGTSGRHITPLDGEGKYRMFEVGTDEKPNGNTVDLDRELTEVTKNGLEFITLMQFLQNKLRTIRSSIADGGNV